MCTPSHQPSKSLYVSWKCHVRPETENIRSLNGDKKKYGELETDRSANLRKKYRHSFLKLISTSKFFKDWFSARFM